jgi:hypothetical protein
MMLARLAFMMRAYKARVGPLETMSTIPIRSLFMNPPWKRASLPPPDRGQTDSDLAIYLIEFRRPAYAALASETRGPRLHLPLTLFETREKTVLRRWQEQPLTTSLAVWRLESLFKNAHWRKQSEFGEESGQTERPSANGAAASSEENRRFPST